MYGLGMVFLTHGAMAQLDTDRQGPAEGMKPLKAGTTIVQLSDTAARYLEMMDSLDAKTLKTTGFRIQIYSSSGPNARKDALTIQSEFLKVYTEYPAYTKWNYPNWVVRLGDYRTRLEALEFHEEVKARYPASFIIKDEISVEY